MLRLTALLPFTEHSALVPHGLGWQAFPAEIMVCLGGCLQKKGQNDYLGNSFETRENFPKKSQYY